MKKVLFLLLSIVLFSFYKPSVHVQMANEIIATTALEIQKETPLYFFGEGGMMMDNIKEIEMSFQKMGEISIEQSRSLVIQCAKLLLNNINENDQIRPHLISYPFTSENIALSIFIYNKRGGDVDSKNLCLVSLRNGKIRYLRDSIPRFEEVHSESYEEAKAILEASK
ncbi:MAG: hypothetical protein SNF33_05305 [Candidatus Algichlamydia australiensis]|nr:hypothetical protein [Chlamydiales bacterium]